MRATIKRIQLFAERRVKTHFRHSMFVLCSNSYEGLHKGFDVFNDYPFLEWPRARAPLPVLHVVQFRFRERECMDIQSE